MKKSFYLLAIVLMFGCNSASTTESSPSPQKISGDEYIYQEIEGTPIKKVQKLDSRNQVILEGFVKDGIKTGEWVEYNPQNGKLLSITPYINGKLNGNYFEFDARDYVAYQASFVNDQLDGTLKKYKNKKLVEKTEYSKGKINGKKISYGYNGNIQEEIEYKNGVIDGKMKYYNDKQELIMEYIYKDGKKISGGTINKDAENTIR